jgi:ABC-type uncharacterized transport system fused permease/ATPase subunit
MGVRLRDIFGKLSGKTPRVAGQEGNSLTSKMRIKLRSGSCFQSPLQEMRNLRGLIGAWWKSDRKKFAWSMAATIVVTTLALTAGGIVGAAVTGQLISSFASVAGAAIDGNAPALAEATSEMIRYLGYETGLIMAGVGINALRDITGKTAHRKWRDWLGDQLEKHFLENRRYVHLLFNRAAASEDDANGMPDNIDQRIQEAVKNFTGSILGLSMGGLGFLTAVIGFGGRLGMLSTALPGMEFMGSWASASLAIGAAMLYVPITTSIAYKLAKKLQQLTIQEQMTEGDYRAELNLLTRSSEQVAAARSESIAKKILNKTYAPVDRVWKKFANATAIYAGFENAQTSLAARIYSYLPAIPGLTSGAFTFAQFNEVSQLVSQLIVQASWPIRVLPNIANVTANGKRVTGLVEAMLRVREEKEHYSKTGIAELEFEVADNDDGIVLENLELMHKGKEKPFITADRLHFEKGKVTAIMGPSGCGKTTLIKAITQLHPYGRGKITLPGYASAISESDEKALYATQEAYLPEQVTLKQLICLPADEDDERFEDLKVAAVLEKVGLGKFIGALNEDNYQGKPWKEVFSGGQKQLAILARILLHKPGILFLDEGVSALDAAAKLRFHEMIRNDCPDTAVISIIHDPELLECGAEGKNFYDSLVLMKKTASSNGNEPAFKASQYDLSQGKGARRLAMRSLRVALGLEPDRKSIAQEENLIAANENPVRTRRSGIAPAPHI